MRMPCDWYRTADSITKTNKSANDLGFALIDVFVANTCAKNDFIFQPTLTLTFDLVTSEVTPGGANLSLKFERCTVFYFRVNSRHRDKRTDGRGTRTRNAAS